MPKKVTGKINPIRMKILLNVLFLYQNIPILIFKKKKKDPLLCFDLFFCCCFLTSDDIYFFIWKKKKPMLRTYICKTQGLLKEWYYHTYLCLLHPEQ